MRQLLIKILVALTVAFLLTTGQPVSAQSTYTWNGGAAGSWDDAGAGWLNGVTAASWSNSTSLVASFTGTAPTLVTVNAGGLTTYGLSFTADGYVLSGGTLTLADPSGVGGTVGAISVATGNTATINCVIAGSNGLVANGGGALVLGGANTYSGGTTVNGGTLTLTAGTTLGGPGTSLSVNNNATLDLGGTTQVVGQVNNGGSGGAVGTITNGTLNLNGNNFFFKSGTLNADLTGGGNSRLWFGGDNTATILFGGVNTVDYSDHHSLIIGHPVTGDAGVIMLTSPTAWGRTMSPGTRSKLNSLPAPSI